MAVKHWVGGTGNWDQSTTTHWSLTNGGASGAAVPSASDDVFFDSGSGTGTVTVTANAPCNSIQSSGSTIATFSHNAAVTISIGSSTAGASNIALDFSGFTTYTLGNSATSAISFVSTSTTQQTINGNSFSFGNVTFNGTGANWALISAFNQGSSASSSVITVTAGALHTDGTSDNSGLPHLWYAFNASGSTTRTLNLGNSTIGIYMANGASNTGWNIGTITNLTFSAGTSTINSTGNASDLRLGALTYATIHITGSGVTNMGLGGGAPTVGTFTRTGTAVKTDGIIFNGAMTITTDFEFNGQSVTNRLLMSSSTIGTQVTLTVNGTAGNSSSNVDLVDIKIAGTVAPLDISGITGNSGDCGGNSGLVLTTPATQTATMSTNQNWSTAAIWTSRVPLPQDNVSLSGVTGGILTLDMPRAGKNIDWTSATGSPTWNNAAATIVYGSITLISGLTMSGSSGWSLEGRSSLTLTSAGKSYGSGAFNIIAPSGTYTLQDAFTVSGNVATTTGTLVSNNFNVTVSTFTNSTNGTVTMGSSTFSLTRGSTGTVWNNSGTVNCGTSTIAITVGSTGTFTFTGGGKTYYNLQYTVPNSPGILLIGGANTFTSLQIGPGTNVQFNAGLTTAITGVNGFNINGVNNGYLYMPAAAANYVTTPDATPLDITGDITMDALLSLPSWSAPSGQQDIISKWGAAGELSYHFYFNSSGQLVLQTSANGTTIITSTGSATGASANAQLWVRVCLQVNDGSGHNVVKFFTGGDGSWTQLGSTITNTGTTSIFNSTTDVEIGSENSATFKLIGNMYRARIFNSNLGTATGTPVYDANFATKTVGANSFTESSSNALTVTINGVLLQAGDGRVAITTNAGGSQATIATSHRISVDYVTVQDNAVTTTIPAYAGRHGILVSNDTNWVVGVPPSGGTMLLMGV